jgi:hypothetical protein
MSFGERNVISDVRGISICFSFFSLPRAFGFSGCQLDFLKDSRMIPEFCGLTFLF